jgi:outer membrane protein TolC
MNCARRKTAVEKKGRCRHGKKQGVILVLMVLWLTGLSTLCLAEDGVKVIDLEEAYRLAMKTQEKILIAAIEIEKSKILPKKAMTIMMPRMSLNGSYTRLNDPIEYEAQLGNLTLPPIQTFPEDQTAGNFEWVQPIYEGQFFPARKKAKEAVEFSMESYGQTIQDVLFKVAQAYYEVLKDERLVQNARETLDLAQEELRVSTVKFKAGDVTEDAVLRAELNISRAQSKIVKNLNSLMLAQDVLKRLTGVEEQKVRIVEPPKLLEKTMDYDEQLRGALENRYDHRRAAVAVKMAESDIELVRAKFHPRLRASWDYYKVSDPGWQQEDNYWVALLKLEIPLFEGGQRYYDLKEKRESLRQAKLALEESKQNIQVDLKGAILKMETEKALLDNSTKEVELAKKNYEITFAKYQYGAAIFSNLTEALVYLDSARTGLITSTFDHQVSILNVQRARGQLAQEYIAKANAN